MEIELRFPKNDLETKTWLINEYGFSEKDFVEIRSFDGSPIIIAVLVAIDLIVKHPDIIDKFLKRDGCEIEFDENGNVKRAKGCSISDIIKLQAASSKKDKENHDVH